MTRKVRHLLSIAAGVTLIITSLCACSPNSDNDVTDAAEVLSTASNSETTATYVVNTAANSDESNLISDTLYGLFLEDINFAIDGGLYSELIKNRSFEYGTAAANENMHGWVKSSDTTVEFSVTDGDTDSSYLNENNTHYAVVSNSGLNSDSPFHGIGNVGYLDGLVVTAGEQYNVSLYLKGIDGFTGMIELSITDKDGSVLAETEIDGITDSWQKYEAVLVPEDTVNDDVRFWVKITAGTVCIDMVSLMPNDTYKDLPIRKDIGEYMEALNPSFLRFPGGCVIEGRDEESMYDWKDSIGNGIDFVINNETAIGDVATRPQGKDIWSGTKQDPYYTTYGIGFYEYFLLCEALDCIPIPVLNAGMTCEVQSPKYIVYPISSEEFQQCIQDSLDLVEFCLGGADTYWGGIRIAMGHEEPFDLTYIAIGNEQWQSEYHAHYEKFVEAFETAAKENPELYGEIELIIANGTASGSMEGWSYVEDYPDSITTLVDEHYYESPDWFLSNTNRYDNYSRDSQAKVFLGEYAAQSNTLNAALAEAAYMTGLERNSDVVAMACYAPLFGNIKTNQWTPDMMFFSNDSVYGSVNYYVQKIFAQNVGRTILSSELEVSSDNVTNDLCGAVGLGSWMTSVAYDNFSVISNADRAVLCSADFEDEGMLESYFYQHEGEWSIKDNRLVQEYTGEPYDVNTGDVVYIGGKEWSNYTLTVDAEILNGGEGFLIPVCVEDEGNNIFWNIGGWGNTVSCLQIVSGNSKSGQITGTVKNLTLKRNQIYELKLVVNGNQIQCYIDDTLYIDYTKEAADSLYETASIDDNGDIILKIVNVTENNIPINTTIKDIDMNSYDDLAIVTILEGDNLSDMNSFEEPDKLVPAEGSLEIGEKFEYDAPGYSVSIIRILAR